MISLLTKSYSRYILYLTIKQSFNYRVKGKWEEKERRKMKKTYKIEVDCANCANKMEEAARNTQGVKDATVNFMMLKMIVEFQEGAEPKAVMEEVLKNCKKVEDDCEIYL